MVRFPEHVQFRAPSGFSDAIDAAAKAKGERYGDFIREAVAERLAAAGSDIRFVREMADRQQEAA